MKNTIKVLGVIALLAIIGFSMAACDDGEGGGGGGGNSLAGTTWKHGSGSSYTTITFSTSTFRAVTVRRNQQDTPITGKYTFNGRSGILDYDYGGTQSFSVNGNELTIGIGTAKYKKQ